LILFFHLILIKSQKWFHVKIQSDFHTMKFELKGIRDVLWWSSEIKEASKTIIAHNFFNTINFICISFGSIYMAALLMQFVSWIGRKGALLIYKQTIMLQLVTIFLHWKTEFSYSKLSSMKLRVFLIVVKEIKILAKAKKENRPLWQT